MFLSVSGPAPAAPYRGRFAPSPTGLLHFGSLVAGLGSYLQARALSGAWLVRIEDLDPPREVPGAADAILRTLEAHGLCWDGEVVFQSDRLEAYQAALEQLIRQRLAYACGCSRREIRDAVPGTETVIYPGTCRSGLPAGRTARAMRLRAPDQEIGFTDTVQGTVVQNLAREVGDFVLRRADGLFAYQLAVVVDDAAQGITEVVRGCDLLDATPRQIYLQRLLDAATPGYAHLPVAVNAQGEKLSKQTLASPIEPGNAASNLVIALAFLGHTVPRGLEQAPAGEILDWAIGHWRLEQVPRQRAAPVTP